MRKYWYYAIFICIFSNQNFAQDKDSSPKFGVHLGYALLDINSNVFVGDTQSGFFLGASLDFNLSESLSLAPKVLYANYSDVGFLHVPIFLNYNLNEQVYFGAGPQMTFVLDDPFNVNKELGIDLGAGLGYNFSEKVYIEARYAIALTNRINEDVDFDEEAISDPDLKYNGFMLGFGYRF
ncbi:outer membrane beta-barrel protein [Croceivirga sp. JEA036]|uniref:outer membrane beta-barrel protein n=1 Tax=Croceivirga sp. JEA036 TaxID=2721162 RepID=UPI001439E889|nr:outer membrane beta-barrel protein [Croceivirga sp. JEA036]NJB37799.1 porin family protein [Croceivirga sp. JEA036]